MVQYQVMCIIVQKRDSKRFMSMIVQDDVRGFRQNTISPPRFQTFPRQRIFKLTMAGLVMEQPDRRTIGRGTSLRPPNRFESTRLEDDFEQLADDEAYFTQLRKVPTQYLPDATQSILTSNDSPDIPFRYSINPYRGCAHGCVYCDARPGQKRFFIICPLPDCPTRKCSRATTDPLLSQKE